MKGKGTGNVFKSQVQNRVQRLCFSWLLVWTLVLTSIGAGLPAVFVTAAEVSDFSVTYTRTGGGDWVEYKSWKITNNSSEKVTGIQILIPMDKEPSNPQSWNLSADYSESAGGIVIYYSEEVAAGSAVTIGGGNSENAKVGFGENGVNVGTPRVIAINSGEPDTGLNYELTGQKKNIAFEDTPVGKHGKLHLAKVSGMGNAEVIVDEHGNPFQLRGASTHGMHWDVGGPFVNKDSFQSLRDEWGVNLVRLVSYVTQGGYTDGSQSTLDEKIQTGVQAAKELGMYAIVDWHIHNENPHNTKSSARDFFKKYATMYKDYDNVIFEICNEPEKMHWYTDGSSDLYAYCKEIAGIIRECGSKALIVCGTSTWSQEVQEVSAKPLSGDGFENILYTLHFYSGSHYDNIKSKLKTAVNDGTPVFVTEFGVCDSSGNGGFDLGNATSWIELCDSYNISYACWSLSNKGESASYLKTGCSKTTGGWTASDLAKTGIWLVNTYRAHQDAEENTDTAKASASPSAGASSSPKTSASASPSSDASSSPKTSASASPSSDASSSPKTSASASPSAGTSSSPKTSASASPSAGASSSPKTSASTSPSSDPKTSPSAGASSEPKASAPAGTSAEPQPDTSAAPGGETVNPGQSGIGISNNPVESPSPTPTAKPTQTPSASPAQPTLTPSPTSTVSATAAPAGTGNKKVKLRLKKTILKIKKGKKAKIAIRQKQAGDTVKKYQIVGKKKIVSVTSKGVVKGRKKGRVTVKVIMKSGATAKCRIIVK